MEKPVIVRNKEIRMTHDQWALPRALSKVFSNITDWVFYRCPCQGDTIVFTMDESKLSIFTNLYHNRFLSIFRNYYNQAVLLDYDTVIGRDKREKDRLKREAARDKKEMEFMLKKTANKARKAKNAIHREHAGISQ